MAFVSGAYRFHTGSGVFLQNLGYIRTSRDPIIGFLLDLYDGGERILLRGGHWYNSRLAGVFVPHLSILRSYAHHDLGSHYILVFVKIYIYSYTFIFF